MNIFSNRNLINKARQCQTGSIYERQLRNRLKNKKIKVLEQKIYPNNDPARPNSKYYTADLYLPKYKLAIHVDGSSHKREPQKSRDKRVEECINKYGHKQVRISNKQVKKKTALQKILKIINEIS